MKRFAKVAIGLGLMIMVAVGTMGAVNFTPEDIILRECDVELIRVRTGHEILMKINETRGDRIGIVTYLMTIDGVSNENRGWSTFKTPEGYAFVMPYTEADAGTKHEYRVSIGQMYKGDFCETHNDFWVKGVAAPTPTLDSDQSE